MTIHDFDLKVFGTFPCLEFFQLLPDFHFHNRETSPNHSGFYLPDSPCEALISELFTDFTTYICNIQNINLLQSFKIQNSCILAILSFFETLVIDIDILFLIINTWVYNI